ncbi:branched-chain amino acid ABC transporter permease [Amphibiibacter pelophylacis]|uniref:Branched-chain amino acid ABC transporter permease n=1 Tax=Amphibiibacter pelophylacis TaxID=1799477 RepID=A0ACC6P497_9BURK
MNLLQLLFDALSLGSLYALGALGIALIFGVMRLVNFAHGDVMTFSVFGLIAPTTAAAAPLLIGAWSTPLLVTATLALGAGLAMLSEALIFRRLRRASPTATMIASFALGFVIQNALLMLHSSRPKSINLWPALSQPVPIGSASVPGLQLLIIAVTLALLVGLVMLLRHSRVGLEMRAAAEDFAMARALGVRANRVILLAFGLSGALAALIGLFLTSQSGVLDLRMGGPMMLVAFVATVIGGLGSLAGAVLGGFLLGAVSTALQMVLPLDARPFRDALVYLGVIALLLWRPQGLFVTSAVRQRI